MTKILPIKKTLEVICNCWKVSESELQTKIRECYPGVGEVFITELFHGLLKDSLDSANKEKLIERAFIADLKAEFPLIDFRENVSRKVAKGLVAEVRLHNQATEIRTGGDLGFVISRPKLSYVNSYNPETDLIISKDYCRGILTQAKMKDEYGKWNNLTETQEKILPKHQKYLALLLYSYSDCDRYEFDPFRWQMCGGYPFSDLKDWLEKDYFPNPWSSTRIINDLGNLNIGTDDPETIKNVICPPYNRSLIIDIHWPGGDPPFVKVRIQTRQKERHEAKRVTW